jgi:hypothetical protein
VNVEVKPTRNKNCGNHQFHLDASFTQRWENWFHSLQQMLPWRAALKRSSGSFEDITFNGERRKRFIREMSGAVGKMYYDYKEV